MYWEKADEWEPCEALAKMTKISFPSSCIGHPFSYIQPGMDFRLYGNSSCWT